MPQANALSSLLEKFCLADSKSPFRVFVPPFYFFFSIVYTAVSVVLGRMAKRRELSRFLLNRTEIRPFIFALGFMSASALGGREGWLHPIGIQPLIVRARAALFLYRKYL